MSSFRSRFGGSIIGKNTSRMPTELKKVSEDVAKIDFDSSPFNLIKSKRKRDEVDEFDRALTNDYAPLFETKFEKQNKATLNLTKDDKTQKHNEISSTIKDNVIKRFKQTTKNTDELTKDQTALDIVRPKIEKLIEEDEESVDLANRQNVEQYYYRANIEYVCDPRISKISEQKLPEQARRALNTAMQENNEQILSGILPEIEVAYVVDEGKLIYWSLSAKNPREEILEFDRNIISVGIAKPPYKFFTLSKCPYILLVGVAHELLTFYINVENSYGSNRIVTFSHIEHTIPCPDVHSAKISFTNNRRAFVGCKKGQIKEIQFETSKSWISKKIMKSTEAKGRNEPNFLLSLLPNIFQRGSNDVEKIEIDESKGLLYSISFRPFDERQNIKPCTIEIFHLGPFCQDFIKVCSISQSEINTKFYKKTGKKEADSIQICTIHPVGRSESHTIDFALITSNGYRMNFELKTVQYATEKLRRLKNVDYTTYYEFKPTGSWEIVSVIVPPLLKDITASASRDCAKVDLTNDDTFITQARYDNGLVWMSGIDYITNKGMIMYIDDSHCSVKSKAYGREVTNSSSKFWMLYLGANKSLIDMQKRSPE